MSVRTKAEELAERFCTEHRHRVVVNHTLRFTDIGAGVYEFAKWLDREGFVIQTKET